ncbi:MAG: T9SS type A sorting domain-containing protein, partial [Flavobacteriales bacterium]
SDFPNPSQDRVNFNITVSATVFYIAGKRIASFIKEPSIDTSKWQQGIYIIQREDGSTLRLIKN